MLKELIAMLDIDKKNIVQVFSSKKEAGYECFTNEETINFVIINEIKSNGHYWKKYEDCSDVLKATYNKPL